MSCACKWQICCGQRLILPSQCLRAYDSQQICRPSTGWTVYCSIAQLHRGTVCQKPSCRKRHHIPVQGNTNTVHGRQESSCRPLGVCLSPGSGQHPIRSHCARPGPPHPALLLQLMSEAHVAHHWTAHHYPAFCLLHLALHLMPLAFCLMSLVDQRQHLQFSYGWAQYAVRRQASASIGAAPRE